MCRYQPSTLWGFKHNLLVLSSFCLVDNSAEYIHVCHFQFHYLALTFVCMPARCWLRMGKFRWMTLRLVTIYVGALMGNLRLQQDKIPAPRGKRHPGIVWIILFGSEISLDVRPRLSLCLLYTTWPPHWWTFSTRRRLHLFWIRLCVGLVINLDEGVWTS